jgi:hypothetical protein
LHTVLGLVDERYQRIRVQRGTRKGFFQPTFRRLKQGQGSFLVRINKFELFVNKDKSG